VAVSPKRIRGLDVIALLGRPGEFSNIGDVV